MKILITGCKGQVGASLVDSLQNDTSVELYAVSRVSLDITDKSAVNKAVHEFQPNVIINAAAYTAVDKAETNIDRCYAINRDGPSILAHAANDIGATIIHISTDYVFSGDKEGRYVESDTTGPTSIYGKSKLAGELAVAEACTRHIVLRTAWVFSEYGNNFVKTMLKLAASHKSLSVVEDQRGGPTYAGDIAQAIICIAKSLYTDGARHYGTYHFSGSPQTNWHSFAKAIFEQARIQSIIKKEPCVNAIVSSAYPTSANRPLNSSLDCQLILDTFGINESDWKSALSHLVNYQVKP